MAIIHKISSNGSSVHLKFAWPVHR